VTDIIFVGGVLTIGPAVVGNNLCVVASALRLIGCSLRCSPFVSYASTITFSS
jgi:hypothetical protein